LSRTAPLLLKDKITFLKTHLSNSMSTTMKKTLFFAALFLFFAGFAQAQNAEDIIAKHLEATGGSNWAKINSIKMEAKIAAEAAAGMSIGWNMTAIRDKAARMDVSVMGMSQVVVVNGDKGWSTNPFAGQNDPEPMTADMIESMKETTDIDGTFVGYKEKGYTVEYVGTEDVEGTEAIKIKINKGKKTEYSLFDPATYYEIKQIEVEEVDGKSVESATTFSNFKTQDGIVMPFTMQQSGGMMGSSTITVSSVTFNPTVDETIFDMPKK
jgi:outer membrane lipoprotein-sorting protein